MKKEFFGKPSAGFIVLANQKSGIFMLIVFSLTFSGT